MDFEQDNTPHRYYNKSADVNTDIRRKNSYFALSSQYVQSSLPITSEVNGVPSFFL